MALWAVYVLFLLSGISGLIYQVVWVREFGAVFGNTVYSAAAVTAVFMCGLGFGGFFVGQGSDRRHRNARWLPLRAYGVFEIGIAILGLAVAFVLPELEELSARFSRYEVGPEGWFELTRSSHLFRYAAAVTLLAPITFLMGGTLTLLIRYVVAADLRATGVRVGVLYGMNTAGAALGAFATDFLLIPDLGILATELVAIALNLVAGVGALVLASRGRADVADERHPPEPLPTTKADASGPRLVLRTAATLFVTGFVAMGFEIVWFRYLISGLGARRNTFSLLMVVILVGIFLGSVIGGMLERRMGQPVRLFMAAQAGFIVVALAPMFVLGTQLVTPFGDPSVLEEVRPSLQGLAEIGINLPHIVAIVGLAALLMGCTFPLANAHVQRVAASVGGRAGALYLATTLGNVAGSVLTGFALLPALGQQGSIAVLAACVPLGLIPLYLSSRGSREGTRAVSGRFFAACIAVLLLCLGGWLALPEHYLLKHVRTDSDTYVPQRVVAVSEGINDSVLVIERSDGRVLYTNGHPMSATIFPAQRYMRLFAHFPLLNTEEPSRALVICFGVGNTLHAASMHPGIEELEIVDLSRNVLEHGPFFSDTNGNILEDDRVSVYVNDGRQHLRMQAPGSYDLITLEPPPIDHAGVASLYTKEFYELARSRLRTGGFMTQWLPAYQVSTGMTLSIIRSFLEAFPDAALLSGYKRELILIGSNGAASHLDPARVREALEKNARVEEDLQRIAAGSLVDLAAAFVAGPVALEVATRDARPVTDDFPAMEYEPKALRFGTRLPVEIFDASEIRDWCEGCFEEDRPIAELAELPQLLEILEQYHRSETFLDFPRHSVNAAQEDPPPLAGQPCRLHAVRENTYFAGIFGCRPPR